MAITRSVWIDDDGTGTTGTPINNAELQKIYNNIDALPLGATWITVPFNAADFQGAGGLVWTVGAPAIQRNKYAVVGKVLFWSFYISWFAGSNVLSGVPGSTLQMRLPAGYVGEANQLVIIDYCSGIAGVQVAGGLTVSAIGTGLMQVSKTMGGNFALTDIPGLIGCLTLEIV